MFRGRAWHGKARSLKKRDGKVRSLPVLNNKHRTYFLFCQGLGRTNFVKNGVRTTNHKKRDRVNPGKPGLRKMEMFFLAANAPVSPRKKEEVSGISRLHVFVNDFH
jgi:hypothetical protein